MLLNIVRKCILFRERLFSPTGHWSYVSLVLRAIGPTACDRTLILSGKSAFETTLISPGLLVPGAYIICLVDLEKCQLHINNFVKTKLYHNHVNTNIEKKKNVLFLHEHIRYCSIYLTKSGNVAIFCLFITSDHFRV